MRAGERQYFEDDALAGHLEENGRRDTGAASSCARSCFASRTEVTRSRRVATPAGCAVGDIVHRNVEDVLAAPHGFGRCAGEPDELHLVTVGDRRRYGGGVNERGKASQLL